MTQPLYTPSYKWLTDTQELIPTEILGWCHAKGKHKRKKKDASHTSKVLQSDTKWELKDNLHIPAHRLTDAIQ